MNYVKFLNQACPFLPYLQLNPAPCLALQTLRARIHHRLKDHYNTAIGLAESRGTNTHMAPSWWLALGELWYLSNHLWKNVSQLRSDYGKILLSPAADSELYTTGNRLIKETHYACQSLNGLPGFFFHFLLHNTDVYSLLIPQYYFGTYTIFFTSFQPSWRLNQLALEMTNNEFKVMKITNPT